MKNKYQSLNKGEFTIFDYETGRDWSNYLWNEIGYVSHITHSACIQSRYINEKNVQIVLNVPKANFIYIRDEETKEYFNPGVYPTGRKVKNYRATHGQNYSKIASEYQGIDAQIEFRLEQKDKREVWKVDVKNTSDKTKSISVFAMTAFDQNGYEQNIYYSSATTAQTLYSEKANGIYSKMQNPYSPFEDDTAFILASEEIFAYEGNLDVFLGTMGTHANPYILENGLDLQNSLATVKTRTGLLQNKIELQPNQVKTLYYILGFAHDEQELIDKKDKYFKTAKALFIQNNQQDKFYLETESPDERINLIMNQWAQKQVNYAAIGKKAVRDNSQLVMGILNYDPKFAKKVLIECLEHQYKDGHAILTYYPYLDHTVYSDPAFWLTWAVCEYIKETGDFAFLEEKVSFIDQKEDTVYTHVKKAVDWYLDIKNYGPNGFPKIYHADWNDALNIPDDQAESVFIAFNIVFLLNEVGSLAKHIKDDLYAETLKKPLMEMKNRINDKAFNGQYYVRAFSKHGVVGDLSNENGGKIYINPQSWAILSETVKDEQLPNVLKAIDAMETEEGLPLCLPAYQKFDKSVGRMSGMLPGVYENGGIYNHAGCFKVFADCKIKRRDQALNTLLKIIPDGKYNPSYKTKTEPYVFTNCYLKHPSVDMQVGFSWQTGTSAWGLRCYYEGILGLKRSYDGLYIDPCIPTTWEKVTAKRLYRNHILNITYINKKLSEVKILVDGEKLDGRLIPLFNDGLEHEIVVYY